MTPRLPAWPPRARPALVSAHPPAQNFRLCARHGRSNEFQQRAPIGGSSRASVELDESQ